MENKVSCSLPFIQIHNSVGGNYSPCCWSRYKTDCNPFNTLPLDYFNSDDLSNLRKDMLIGNMTELIQSACGHCFEQEKENGSSIRKDLHSRIDDNILKNFDSDGKVLYKTRFLHIKINFSGNYCNLECYECFPVSSSSRTNAIKKLSSKWDFLFDQNVPASFNLTEDIKKSNKNQLNLIINQLVNNADYIKTIEILGGEPALMKSHFELLDRLIECGQSKNISLSYVSNMTLLRLDLMKKYFDSFPFTFLQWSVDALKDRNYWLRYPTNWDTTIKNVFDIQKYFHNNKNGVLKSTITPSLLSISTLSDTYFWLYENNLISEKDFLFNTVMEPKMLRTRNLPNELKEEIASSVKIVSEFHYNDLMQPRNEEEFQQALEYFDELDRSRGTDWRSTFPEVAKYAKRNI